MANTPLRSFRIADDVYEDAKAKADEDGRSLTAVIVDLLKQYSGYREQA
jgi:hypothetical protein